MELLSNHLHVLLKQQSKDTSYSFNTQIKFNHSQSDSYNTCNTGMLHYEYVNYNHNHQYVNYKQNH